MEQVQKAKNFVIKYKSGILLVIGAILTSVGSILLDDSSTKTSTKKYTIDYTNCIKIVFEELDPISCRDDLKDGNEECDCNIDYNITQPIPGQVTLYYELTEFKQSAKYLNSRDDDQLRGIISQTPSEKCDPFRYANVNGTKKPIVPCGEIADSMFTDKFDLILKGRWTNVPLLYYDMLSAEDKIGFHNPKNLKQAFQNFSKPISWQKNIWELDMNNDHNNGFQNEAFISWMRTDWKRKPIARVNHSDPTFADGLPVGTYVISIGYNYPPSKYDGPRLLVLEGISRVQSHSSITAGAILLFVGLLTLIACALPYVLKYIKERRKRNQASTVKSTESDTAKPQIQSESPFLN